MCFSNLYLAIPKIFNRQSASCLMVYRNMCNVINCARDSLAIDYKSPDDLMEPFLLTLPPRLLPFYIYKISKKNILSENVGGI